MAKPRTTVISERVYNQNQSWYFKRTVKVGTHKLRTRIRRNAYDFQSSALVERWDGDKWRNVCSAPIMECECRRVSYVQNGITAAHFENDHKRLLKEALAIVN